METKQQDLELTAGALGTPGIDMKAKFGDTYRVRRDENGDQFIPHKRGHFYAHSDIELACFVNGNRKFNMIHEQFPDIRATQRGDQEIIFVFNPDLLPELAKVLKAFRRVQYSPEVLAKKRALMLEARQHLTKKPLPEISADLFTSAVSGYGSAENDGL